MGVNLSSLHICMAEQFLEHTDVHPVLQHMGRKTVAQGMTAYLLIEPCLLCSSFHRLLQAGFAHVMTHLPARARVQGARTGRKHPVPAGLPCSLWVFPGKGLGAVYFSEPLFKSRCWRVFTASICACNSSCRFLGRTVVRSLPPRDLPIEQI